MINNWWPHRPGGWSSDGDKKEDTKINCACKIPQRSNTAPLFPTTPCSVRSETPSPASPSSTCQLLPCVKNCFEETRASIFARKTGTTLRPERTAAAAAARWFIRRAWKQFYDNVEYCFVNQTRDLSHCWWSFRGDCRIQPMYFKEDVSAKVCLELARQWRFKLGFYWLKKMKKNWVTKLNFCIKSPSTESIYVAFNWIKLIMFATLQYKRVTVAHKVGIIWFLETWSITY